MIQTHFFPHFHIPHEKDESEQLGEELPGSIPADLKSFELRLAHRLSFTRDFHSPPAFGADLCPCIR